MHTLFLCVISASYARLVIKTRVINIQTFFVSVVYVISQVSLAVDIINILRLGSSCLCLSACWVLMLL